MHFTLINQKKLTLYLDQEVIIIISYNGTKKIKFKIAKSKNFKLNMKVGADLMIVILFHYNMKFNLIIKIILINYFT